MRERYIEVQYVRKCKKDPEWPKYRLVDGVIQRLRSEHSVPEYLYNDERTREWREVTYR